MTICQMEELDAGRSYPRTCPTCGISGNCTNGLSRKSLIADRAEWKARAEKAESALKILVDLNENYSPFGGEIYRDRVDRAWDNARKTIREMKGPHK